MGKLTQAYLTPRKDGEIMPVSEILNPEGKRYKHLRGVVCDVKNCAYHDGDSYCAASRIAVCRAARNSCS